MAEAVLEHRLKKEGLEGQVEVDSAGMIGYHQGEGADPRARMELEKHGIEYHGNARQITKDDFFRFDLILGMTRSHVAELNELRPDEATARIGLFLDFAGLGDSEVPDPYYDDRFGLVYELVVEGVEGLMEEIKKKLSESRNQRLATWG